MHRGKSIEVQKIFSEARNLILEENPAKAERMLAEASRKNDHAALARLRASALLMMGEVEKARSLIRKAITHVWAPLPADVSFAADGHSLFYRLPLLRILYIHVPKCASSTVKNIIYDCARKSGDADHSGKAPTQRLNRNDLVGGAYAGWMRFLVVRDPIERMRSFWRSNIAIKNELSRDAGGQSIFLGLPTQPDYRVFAENLVRYQQVFRCVMRHTAPLVDIAGGNTALFTHIYGLGDLDRLRSDIESHCGIALPPSHRNMTPSSVQPPPGGAYEDNLRHTLFRTDYEIYGRWFS